MGRAVNNILLINPHVSMGKERIKKEYFALGVPLGLGYIGAVVEREGYNIRIVDSLAEGYNDPIEAGDNVIRFGLSDNDIIKIIKEFKPHVIGITGIFSKVHNSICDLCSLIRRIDDKIVIALGGGHCTFQKDFFLEKGLADFVILGEGEYAFLGLLDHLNGKREIAGIDGISYVDKKSGKIRTCPKNKYIEDIDELPFPARHLLPMHIYKRTFAPHSDVKQRPYASLITSRGCPFSCCYCTSPVLWGRKYRMRSPESVLSEIRHLTRDYQIKEINFEDDNMTMDRARAIKIFDGMIREFHGISWTNPNGFYIMSLNDDELLDKIKESGNFSLVVALESGVQRTLDLIRKPVKIAAAENVIKKIKKRKMRVRGFFILGYPGETKADMRQTVRFAKRLQLDWATFSIASPLPGSELFEICRKKNYLNAPKVSDIGFGSALIDTEEFDHEYVQRFTLNSSREINFHNNVNLTKDGNIDSAIYDFKRLSTLYPDLDIAHYYLAKAYLVKAARYIKLALESLLRAKKANCDFPGIAPSIEKVKKIIRDMPGLKKITKKDIAHIKA